MKYIFLLFTTILIFSCTKDFDRLLSFNKIEFVVGSQIDSEIPSTGIFVNELIWTPFEVPVEIPIVGNMPFLNRDGLLTGDRLYLDKKKMYNIRAYAPYVEGLNSNSLTIPFEHGTDVLWANVKYPLESQGGVINRVNLEYSHLTTKAGFILEDERDVISKQKYDFSNVSFSVSGFCSRFYLDINSGELIRPAKDPSVVINQQKVSTCFAPSPLATDYEVEIEIPSVDSLLPPQRISSHFSYFFKPGHSYRMTIVVNTNDITVTGDIIKWEAQLSDNLEL
jgi:hypothetical protein